MLLMARRFKGRRFLHVDPWDQKEFWMKQPHEAMPTVTVEWRDDWQHTWTYNLKSGHAVPPPGRGWEKCIEQSQPGSTESRRAA
jgi:hypothetical protein